MVNATELDGLGGDVRRGFATNAAGGAKADAADAKNRDTATEGVNFMADFLVD
jgi:hypothetical protein